MKEQLSRVRSSELHTWPPCQRSTTFSWTDNFAQTQEKNLFQRHDHCWVRPVKNLLRGDGSTLLSSSPTLLDPPSHQRRPAGHQPAKCAGHRLGNALTQFRFPQLVGWLARALLVVELVNLDQHLQCVGGPDGPAELGPVELGPASVSGRTRWQLIAQLNLATRGSVSPGRSSEHSSCLPIEHTYMSTALILSTVFQST